MKFTIIGDVKPYYLQMLAMLFFPGESFSEKEDTSDSKLAEITVEDTENGTRSTAIVTVDDRVATGEAFIREGDVPADMKYKIASGGALLDALTALTGYTPPWGMLTGVRPAKRAEDLHSRGFSEEDAVRFFTEIYKTREEKARLAVTTAAVARKIVTPERRRECSLYIAIPFCPTRCSYCSFVSYSSPKLLSLIPEYLSALIEDIKNTFALIKQLGMKLSTVYIGGGTPTTLNESQLALLLETIAAEASGIEEFTLEAGRPDTITEAKLASAMEYGVTRLSVNTQTLNEEVLRAIGRAHSAEDFFRAYAMAENSGVRDINVDLIAGLPGDTYESFVSSLERISALKPTNVTVHTFSVKRSAELKTEGHDVFDRDGGSAGECVLYSERHLTDRGYLPYYMYRQKNTVGNLENVGYAHPGHEGLYNIFMMDEIHTVFACGASSVTKLMKWGKDGKETLLRMFEPKYPYEYMRLHLSSDHEKVRRERESEILKFFS